MNLLYFNLFMVHGTTNFRLISSQPIKCQCCPHVENSQLICCANQLTGFYMRATLALSGLIHLVFVALRCFKIKDSPRAYLLTFPTSNDVSFFRKLPLAFSGELIRKKVPPSQMFYRFLMTPVPTNIYMFKVNSINSRTRCEIC